MSKDLKGISKFISFVLRHKPESIGLQLDDYGWADTKELIAKANANAEFPKLTVEVLRDIVATSDKQRFAFNNNQSKIRANQGHSIEVDLDLKPTAPPAVLYHGTAEKNLEAILHSGLSKMKRHHVHLSEDVEMTMRVAQRHGKPVLLVINAQQMQADGHEFYVTGNNVWLVDAVNAKYISHK